MKRGVLTLKPPEAEAIEKILIKANKLELAEKFSPTPVQAISIEMSAETAETILDLLPPTQEIEDDMLKAARKKLQEFFYGLL